MTGEPPAAGPRRRRRRRATRAQGAPQVAVPPVADEPATIPPRKRKPAQDRRAERGLRDLVDPGRSQLGVSGALRGRDVNRPTAEDLADAERDTMVVRRNWKPPGDG
jgi:hypothetical protein